MAYWSYGFHVVVDLYLTQLVELREEMQREIREQGAPGTTMSAADHATFVEGFEAGKLNKPEWPGHVIAKLALHTKPELNGKYFG